ncbi:ATP F0F1 synthase subunit B [Phenylobacterium immobile]|uniref:F0F1 ATP synthase subunit B family protein n=1 Tax=Phenylobacterium immobile TaxID=21 RepID=UPI000B1C18B3|nr:ATP F0F1 synthase subunit B [Phenylobacterium immobile]
MPAFFTAEFWNLANPELWVGVGFLSFLLIVWFAGGFKMAAAALDSKAAVIQTDLDEAARIRAEAEALLADIQQQRDQAEAQAKAMLASAEAQARQLGIDAKVRLEESIAIRTRLAERKIAAAEAEATAQVRAAAIDLAAKAAETVLAGQLAASKSDPLIDRGIAQLAEKLQ